MESLPFRNGRIYGIIFGFRSEGRILAGLQEGIAGTAETGTVNSCDADRGSMQTHWAFQCDSGEN